MNRSRARPPAPKAIATIRSLADTLEDRATIVQLQRKTPGARVCAAGRAS
jgi:hypothetical protein